MRIWLLPSAYAPHLGGVEELTARLARHLLDRGHDVLVVTNRHPADLPAAEQVEGVEVRRVALPAVPGRHPARMLRHLAARRSVDAALAALGPPPDVVHVVCASSQLGPAARLARGTGAALVVTTQGETEMDADRLYQRSAWARRTLRHVAARADALTACSAWTAERTARVAPAFAGARVVLNGVDPDDLAGTGPPPDAPRLCAWGRHVPQKGFDLLLRAYERVRESVPDATLELGGSGPESERLRALAGPGTALIGPLDRAGVAALLTRSRVAVVPSRVEPFGIVAVEALAAGRGLVYATGSGLPEAAGPVGEGVDPHDTAAFAAALARALTGPVDEQAARARSRELAWPRIVDEYEEIYRVASDG